MPRETTLRSPLLFFSALLYSVAALLSLRGLIALLDSSTVPALTKLLFDFGIMAQSALRTWLGIHIAISVLGFLCPTALAIALWVTSISALREPDRASVWGLRFLVIVARCLLWLAYAAAAFLAGLFLFRFVRYIVGTMDLNEGVFLIFAMLLTEGILGTLTGFVFFFFIRFLRKGIDTLEAISYSELTGQPDNRSISMFVSVFLVLIGIFSAVLGLFYLQNSFDALRLMLILPANVLLAIFLRRYKGSLERRAFARSRNFATN